MKPSLVPDDVWKAYREQSAAVSPEGAESPSSGEVEIDIDLEVPVVRQGPPSPRVAALALASADLFSCLPPERLHGLAIASEQLRVGLGGLVFQEGDMASSLYLVLDGTVELSRRGPSGEILIRRAEQNEPVGLLELFYSRERVTKCRAQTDATLLEIPAEALERVLRDDPEMRSRMLRFYEERLVWGFIVACAQLTTLDPTLWARLMARFKERVLREDETLVLPGEVSHLLTVVVSGALHLEQRPRPGEPPTVQSVLPGQFLAVTSALSGEPCRLRVFAPEPTTVMEVSHRDLAELLREFPSLRHLADALAQARQVERDVYCGDTQEPIAPPDATG